MFSSVWEVEDIESNLSDEARTTRELTKAKSSIIELLSFEGEDSSMFSNARRPTLDTLFYLGTDGTILHSFFGKPMCPN